MTFTLYECVDLIGGWLGCVMLLVSAVAPYTRFRFFPVRTTGPPKRKTITGKTRETASLWVV